MADALNDPELSVSPISIDPDQVSLDDDDVLDLLEHLSASNEVMA
jgi:hypothetical protein